MEKREMNCKKELYYEDLIHNQIVARSGVEMVIQRMTQKDAGLVLSIIGLKHPASPTVFKYLADQKYRQAGTLKSGFHMLIRCFTSDK